MWTTRGRNVNRHERAIRSHRASPSDRRPICDARRPETASLQTGNRIGLADCWGCLRRETWYIRARARAHTHRAREPIIERRLSRVIRGVHASGDREWNLRDEIKPAGAHRDRYARPAPMSNSEVRRTRRRERLNESDFPTFNCCVSNAEELKDAYRDKYHLEKYFRACNKAWHVHTLICVHFRSKIFHRNDANWYD